MNKSFVFIPYEQIGDLVFGMTRDQVRKICGECKFSRMYGYPVENRYLDDFGYMHGLYSSEHILEAVELFPVSSIEYKNIKVSIGEDACALIEELKKITNDIKYVEEDESYVSEKLGLMIYCPEHVVEDVLIYTKHYFDVENEDMSNQEL